MMKGVSDGFGVFRTMDRNSLPSYWDSLLQVTSGAPPQNGDETDDENIVAAAEWYDNLILDKADFTIASVPPSIAKTMHAMGFESLRYVAKTASYTPQDDTGRDCSDPAALILGKTHAVVAGNIFMSPAANGCGFGYRFAETADGDFSTADYGTTGNDALFWRGNYERILGSMGALPANQAIPASTPIMMAVGVGPSSNLTTYSSLDGQVIDGLSSVPTYQDAPGAEDYNRFIVLLHVGSVVGSGTANADGGMDVIPTFTTSAQVNLVAVITSEGLTNEEELGRHDRVVRQTN